MKKTCLALVVVSMIIASCSFLGKPKFTLLGDGTPYLLMPEKMKGRVDTVIEKNYMAIRTGDTYQKGAPLTNTDRDSLRGWTSDFRAVFNKKGQLLTCYETDEKGEAVRKYKVLKQQDSTTFRGDYFVMDTLNFYDVYKLDAKGNRIGFTRYNPKKDTMTGISEPKKNPNGDTIFYRMVNAKGVPGFSLLVIFNKEGQFVRNESYNKNGEFRGSTEVKYNDRGKMSDQLIYDKDKKIVEHVTLTYEYDSKGNWIKAIEKTTKGKVVYVERTYKYY